MTVSVNPSRVRGSVRAPPSKSYTHRAFALALLAGGKSVIRNPLVSRDTLATIDASRAFGAMITTGNSLYEVSRESPLRAPENVINTENSGTTIRIMISIASLVERGFTVLTGDESIRKRPMAPLLDALHQLGVECWSTRMDGAPPIIVRGGGMQGGEVEIEGSISSQFLSSLLIASPFARNLSSIRVSGHLVSKPYVEATLAMMAQFGREADVRDSLYTVPSGAYTATDFTVPSDFSSASLLLASAALTGGDLLVRMENIGLPQADREIIEILEIMGADVSYDEGVGGFRVRSEGRLKGGDFDLGNSPDLLPVVSILALKSNEKVTIGGVAHARYKETDRLRVLASELPKAGARVEERDDGLTIEPPDSIPSCRLDAHNDHRIFMALCVAALASRGRCLVDGAESVDVSYPNFIEDMRSISGEIEVI